MIRCAVLPSARKKAEGRGNPNRYLVCCAVFDIVVDTSDSQLDKSKQRRKEPHEMRPLVLMFVAAMTPILLTTSTFAQSEKRNSGRLKAWGEKRDRDENGDNQLSLTELTAYFRTQAQKQQQRFGGNLPKAVPMQQKFGLVYAKEKGVDENLLSLDVYAPKKGKNHPVMVFIHGGGWRKGDKANKVVSRIKAPHFVGAGYVLVSINYRLSPKVKHPTHVQDVAKALGYVHKNITKYGGDPKKIFIMGHSAGAHLAALVAVDERYLKAEGKDLGLLSGVVLLDSAAYDIPRFVKDLKAGPQMIAMYKAAFGPEKNWKDASPRTHVAPQKNIPPFLIFHTGNRLAGATLSRELANALNKAGSPSQAVHAWDKTHGTMNSDIGRPGDWSTQMVMAFLKTPKDVKELKTEGRPAKTKAAKGGIFDKLDTNKDGKVSRKEFQRLPIAKKRPKLFDALDRNGDGYITREESQAFTRRRSPNRESNAPRPKSEEEN